MKVGSFMKRLKDIPTEAKASVAYTVCSIVQRGAAILVLPLFTRLLTTEQYGLTSVYLSWFAFFSIILSLNLPYGSFQTAMVKFENQREAYVASLEGIYVLLSTLFLLVYLPFQSFWNGLLGMPTILVIVMVFEVAATSCIQSWMGLRRFQFKYKSVFSVTIALAILAQVSSLLLVLLVDDKGVAKVVGSAIVTVSFGIVIGIMGIVRGRSLFSKKLWRYALCFNIPLIAYYMSQVVFNQSDILMINYFCGADKAGIYNVAYSLAMLLTFLITAIQGSYTPWFYGKLVKHEERADRAISTGLAVALACFLLVIVIATPEIVSIMAGEAYVQAIWIVPPVAASVLLLFYACLFDRLFFFYEKKLYLTIGTIVPAVINIALNALLIPILGFIVAGYTTFISYCTLVLVDYCFVRKLAPEVNLDLRMYNFKGLGFTLVAFIAVSALMMCLYPFSWLRYGILVAVLVTAFIFRKRAFEIFSRIRKPDNSC